MKRSFLSFCTLAFCLLAFTEARAQNQIDDTEFFVRQQFQDFGISNPSNSEIFSKISQIDACGTNAACRNTQRVLVSRSLWDDSRFRAQSRTFGLGLTSGMELYDNHDFVELSYLIYLQRASSDPPDDAQRLGFHFWKGGLDNCVNNGTTFSQSSQCYNDIVNAFLSSIEYRSRFGTP